MRILHISEAGYSCDLALRMSVQHEVKVWIKTKDWKEVYDGILDKVEDWRPHVRWADLIVFDHTGLADIWKQVNPIKPCFGGSEFADKLEKDRPFAKSLFKKAGLKDFEHLRFNTIEEAVKHVQTHKVKHVVKPVGDKVDSHHVIISEDESGEDAAALLKSFKDAGLVPKYLEVEERKEGIEVGLSGWFNGKEWSGDININFEHKRFATGYPEGCGPLTGEMGTAMIYQPRSNPLFLRTLDKFKPILQENDYRGQIDISFIINEQGDFPLEATPRLGYPACMIEDPLQITPWADLFDALAHGSNLQNQTLSDWAIGVVCVMPGYPSVEEAFKRSYEIPIFGISEQNVNSLHLVEVKTNEKGKTVTCRGQGYPMVITGIGPTIQQAKVNAYKNLSYSNPNRVRCPNQFYRVDIGDRVIRQEKDLYRFGILNKN